MTTEKPKHKMTTKQKVSTIAMLLIVVGAIWYIYNQWVIFQNKVSDINGHFMIAFAQTNDTNSTDTNSTDPLTEACQGDKIIVENAKSLGVDEAQSIIDKYNEQCGSITGPE